MVAPRVGVRIEIFIWSLLSFGDSVAPCVGARIEITYYNVSNNTIKVAPRVGAWIEIYKPLDFESYPLSHPVWVCGLKIHRAGIFL